MSTRVVGAVATAAMYLMVILLVSADAQDSHTTAPGAVSPRGSTAPATGEQSEPGVAPEPRNISLSAGKSTLIETSIPIERISVGLGDFAVATAISPYEVLVDGKAPGATSLIIWQQGGTKLLFDILVQSAFVAADGRVEGIERQLAIELPGQDVHLTKEGDAVFLRGKVKDITAADRALSIAATLGKTVNLLYVDVPVAEPQIMLKVKFASVDRNLSNQLGMNLFSTGATNTVGSLTTQQFSPPGFAGAGGGASPGVTLSDALNLFLFRPDLNLGATIKALESRGLLEVLAEPDVLAQNGQQASFLAGGEFPFPVVQGSTGGGAAAVTIQFREFGIRLNFVPTITPRGSILLRVAPEVSALDFTHGLTVNGFAVPALTIRKLNTAVELNAGQSFAIGGLLDNRVTDTFEKVPLLGNIPVIGKFFQSRFRNKENTELIVIVTPELVQPATQALPVPELKFPVPFLPANTSPGFGQTGIGSTGDKAVITRSTAIPVETLIKSLQRESPNSQQPQPQATLPQPMGAASSPANPVKQ